MDRDLDLVPVEASSLAQALYRVMLNYVHDIHSSTLLSTVLSKRIFLQIMCLFARYPSCYSATYDSNKSRARPHYLEKFFPSGQGNENRPTKIPDPDESFVIIIIVLIYVGMSLLCLIGCIGEALSLCVIWITLCALLQF